METDRQCWERYLAFWQYNARYWSGLCRESLQYAQCQCRFYQDLLDGRPVAEALQHLEAY